jgi:hypothetical protein
LLVTVAVCLLSACGGGPLEGDWFICRDAGCGTLDEKGIRFRSDDTWVPLIAYGSSADPRETYCNLNINGSYEVQDDGLTLHGVSSAELTSVSIDMADSVPSSQSEADPTDPASRVVQIRFEVLDERATLTLVENSATVVLQAFPEAGPVPCPSAVPGIWIDLPSS